ncbi:MAG: MjaI family restriction endonuclease [Armatimonadota bacterium]|jgi:uncharacterized protein YukE
MLLKISWDDIADALEIDTAEFPKYASPLLNLANQYAQATRPRVVGQMSELIEEFPGDCVEGWEDWYGQQMPDAMDEAVDRIEEKIRAFRDVLEQIDREMIARWVRDLVICKTYQGMRFQAAVLKHVASETKNEWTRATPEEEAMGIDGRVGSTAVSIKPETYEAMKQLREGIGATMIVYRKTRRHLEVEFDPDEFN